MPEFIPLYTDGSELGRVVLGSEAMFDMRMALSHALNYNPSTPEFAANMESVRPQLGALFDPWMAALTSIRTDHETADHINFSFEDWITSWRIADFVDGVWTVAHIHDDPAPAV